MSPYLNITENMWSDLNHVGLVKRTKNISELEKFCKEEQRGKKTSQCNGRKMLHCFVILNLYIIAHKKMQDMHLNLQEN